MSDQVLNTPVLIVGAGAVGAILALELARHDVASMVVERSAGPPHHPSTDLVSGRSMELLRRLNLARPLRVGAGVAATQPSNILWTGSLAEPPAVVWHQPSVDDMIQLYSTMDDGAAPVEPYQRVCGPVLETLIRDAARRHPLVDLREGWTFTDLSLEPDGVGATVVDPDTQTRRSVRARFLAACDGASSTVRRCLRVGLDESRRPMPYVSVHLRSGDPALHPFRPAYLTVCADGVTLAAADDEGWIVSVPAGSEESFTTDVLSLVHSRLGLTFRVDEVVRVSQLPETSGVATTFRKGMAFLVGDAAHRFHPVGGHGINTGIGDAVNLGWKLAAVVRGWGGPDLLNSYELERRPVALVNRELCAEFLEVAARFSRLASAGASREELAGLLRRQAHHVDNTGFHFGQRYSGSPVIWHEDGEAPPWDWHRITPTTWPGGRPPAARLTLGTQLFDELGVGFTLVDLSARDAGAALVAAAVGRGIPMTHLAVDDPAVRRHWERDLVLVRPDQHVAWRDNDPPADWQGVLDRVTGVQAQTVGVAQ